MSRCLHTLPNWNCIWWASVLSAYGKETKIAGKQWGYSSAVQLTSKFGEISRWTTRVPFGANLKRSNTVNWPTNWTARSASGHLGGINSILNFLHSIGVIKMSLKRRMVKMKLWEPPSMIVVCRERSSVWKSSIGLRLIDFILEMMKWWSACGSISLLFSLKKQSTDITSCKLFHLSKRWQCADNNFQFYSRKRETHRPKFIVFFQF